MSKVGTLTRADLTKAVHTQIGLSSAECSHLIEAILDNICVALQDGNNVKITGFGSFVLRDKPGRIGRNPKTGVEVPIDPRRVLTFRASPKMRDRIAQAG